MNRNDEQFDEFLRSEFKHKTFELKDQYWKNAQQLIATHRATAGQGMLNIVATGIIVVALSAGLLWNSAITPSTATQEKPLASASALTLNSTDHNPDLNHTHSPEKSAAVATSHDNEATTNSSSENTAASNPVLTRGDKLLSHRVKQARGFAQQQRTRKSASVLAVSQTENTAAQAASEPVIAADPVEIIYINGKVFRPVITHSGKLANNSKQPEFLTYTASRSKGFVTLEAGVNSYNNFSEPASSVNLHGGIKYYRFVSPKFAVSAGLNYARLQQNMDARVYRNIDYSFGQTNTETKITTLRLDYIELPVNAYYNVSGNHFIQTGASLGYVIASHDLVETNGTKSNTDNRSLNAVNKMDVQLNIGYTYMINNRYILSATYHAGLTDISKDVSFRSDKADRNNGIRFTVGYKLF